MGFFLKDLNLIKLFFRYANFVQYNSRSHGNVLKISKCFNFNLIISVCYFPTGISKCRIIIDKKKDKTGDLRKLSTQNIITVRSVFFYANLFRQASWIEA